MRFGWLRGPRRRRRTIAGPRHLSLMPAPHPPLSPYYRTEGERSAWVRGIFDRTAADYDRLERIVGLWTGSWYRRRALRDAGLKPGMSVVDVGTGTGLLACAAARIVGRSEEHTSELQSLC